MYQINVDCRRSLGIIKPMNAVNNGPIVARADQPRGNLDAYAAAHIPFARNHDASFCAAYGGPHTVDVLAIFQDFDADPTKESSYDFVLTDQYIEDTLAAGTETFYRLGHRIEHEAKKYGTYPPPDFEKWSVICEHIIRHCNEGWAGGKHYGIRYWEIWNEPDLDRDDSPNKRNWQGTEEQFFQLYEVSAKHLKACFPSLHIGGPALGADLKWAREFLAEMKRRGAPIDFFSWHLYADQPQKIVRRALRVRQLLDDAGFSSAESICDEWNYIEDWSDGFIPSIREVIGIKGAAFNADTMLRCQNCSVDMLMYYDAAPSVFNGLFDYYTMDPIKGFYPFLMWSRLARLGRQIPCETDCPAVSAVAATDGIETAVMLARFTYDDEDKTVYELALNQKPFMGRKVCAFLVDRDSTMSPIEPGHIELAPLSFALIEIRP